MKNGKIGCAGDHHANCIGELAAQMACRQVGLITEALRRIRDPLARLLIDVIISGQRARYGRDGQPDLIGNGF
jgi:hypothetical protein